MDTHATHCQMANDRIVTVCGKLLELFSVDPNSRKGTYNTAEVHRCLFEALTSSPSMCPCRHLFSG